MSVKSVTVLGSTGSIGKSTIDLLMRTPEKYKTIALTGNKNIALLAQQAKTLRAQIAVTADEKKYAELKEALSGTGIEAAAGAGAVADAAGAGADWTMCSIVGAAGLVPAMRAIKGGKTIALANKETLVCAGEIVLRAIKERGALLLPVDSEHGAIFQCLQANRPQAVDRLILTASGGPFREKTKEFMFSVTPEQAVAHPNWSMGAKISVDSATMMNKGLELIEAYHLFGFSADKIEILIHPQSVVHSAVAYIDGAVLAQLGTPDMRTPIAYALGWPERIETPVKRLDFTQMSALTFFKPDEEKFPSLSLARRALKLGQGATCVMNAANEVAVYAFLEKKIGFLDIAQTVENILEKYVPVSVTSVEDVLELDGETRKQTEAFVAALRKA